MNRFIFVLSLLGCALGNPPLLLAQSATAATVTGTITDSGATVTVNGVPASVDAQALTFTAQHVPLDLGENRITATAIDGSGKQDAHTVVVYVGVPLSVQGTISDDTATVTVNGVNAPVGGGQFSADVAPALGRRPVTANASDSSGGSDTSAIDVFIVRPPVEHP